MATCYMITLPNGTKYKVYASPDDKKQELLQEL